MRKIIMFFLCITILFYCLSISASADELKANNTENQDLTLNRLNDESPDFDVNVFLEIDKRHFSEETICISYLLSNNMPVMGIDYTQSGIVVSTIYVDSQNSSRIVLEFVCLPDVTELCLELQILTESEDVLIEYLYAVNYEEGVFISPFSIDDAYESYFAYALQNNLMTEEDCDAIRAMRWTAEPEYNQEIQPPEMSDIYKPTLQV